MFDMYQKCVRNNDHDDYCCANMDVLLKYRYVMKYGVTDSPHTGHCFDNFGRKPG